MKGKRLFIVQFIIMVIMPIISIIMFKEAFSLISNQYNSPDVWGQFMAIFIFAGLSGALFFIYLFKIAERVINNNPYEETKSLGG